MHEDPGIEIKKSKCGQPEKLAAHFYKPKTNNNMEDYDNGSQESLGCSIVAIGTIIFWAMAAYVLFL